MKMEAMYEQLGVSRAVYEYGEEVLASLRPRFFCMAASTFA